MVLIVLEVVAAAISLSSDATTNTSTAASVMSFLAALALAGFLYFEHRHAIGSSPIPSLYLTITILLDAAKARSFFLRRDLGLYSIACLTSAVTATKILLLFMEEVPKRYRVAKGQRGPETTCGFWSRTLLVWINPTIFLGFKNILSVDDLPNLDQRFSSARLAAIFEPIWNTRKSTNTTAYSVGLLCIERKSSLQLMKATFRALLWPFLAVVPARTLYIGFIFADPFLLRRILQQVGDENRESDVDKGLIGAVALVRLGVAVRKNAMP